MQYLRSFINFGAPLNYDGVRYEDSGDRYRDQLKHVSNFQVNIKDYIDKMQEEMTYLDHTTIIFSEEVVNEQLETQAQEDTMWAGGSVIFVTLYFIFHLESVILAFYSMLLVLLSFPVTQALYRGALGITFFDTIHNLVIFIVLGIAADDVFVITDAWRQSEHFVEFEGNYRKRIAYTMRRASKAIFVTASTTSVAFLANMFSKLLIIQGFGIYAAMIIPVNFVLISIMLPPMLVFYDRNLKWRTCCPKSSQKDDEKSD